MRSQIGTDKDSGELNEEEAKELDSGGVRSRVEEWKRRVPKETLLATEEVSEAAVGECGAATGNVGESGAAARSAGVSGAPTGSSSDTLRLVVEVR